ncbi:endonuclease/exonuclease/phosphatase family protein [Hamadaea tsunoensis]|uniref:endonuclease/exonuclease/phosphatase family protein n=1 Tax=Hamadaea tsunoensis TaxID=53368 RepID=UPI00146FB6A1|nr:endonuclease/exonuclease/phosphatase family protein [Hamadaea tsunoensis]
MPPTVLKRHRRWPTRLAVAACSGWLLLVALHWLLSGRAYWWGPADLLPPFVFALVPVLLLGIALAVRVRWKLVGVPLLALAVGLPFSGFNFATLWYSPPAEPAGAITVVTWNTEYWDQDWEPGGPHTTDQFYAFLKAMNADVYMLQEYAHVDLTLADTASQALAIDQTDRLRAEFPGYEIVIAGRDITLSRLPVVGHSWLDTTKYLPDDLKAVPHGLATRPLFYQSQTLRTDIRVDGQVVSFYDSHLYQPPQRIFRLRGDPGQSMFAIDRFNFEMRKASLEALQEDIGHNPNRVVLGGDFNTSPAMGVLRMVPDRLVDQSRALSSFYPTTWQAGRYWWRLDWLFTTPDVTVSSYDQLSPAGFSDHKVQRIRLAPR